VLFVDMTETFRRNRETVYIEDDGHPSVAGHALIAEEIIHTIQRERLLDR
jgi:lysophospholipase L1-like esterase